jgi:hypothetical protein
LLRDLNAWDSAADARYGHTIEYLEQLARAPRALVIHGNYLCSQDIAFLAANSARMTVVFCPRTHRFFRHEPYPLARMLGSGVDSSPSSMTCRGRPCSNWARWPALEHWGWPFKWARSRPANWPISRSYESTTQTVPRGIPTSCFSLPRLA